MSAELTLNKPAQLTSAPIAILEAAVKGGINSENVAVVKEIVAMCREQRAEDAKAAFARSFFQMKKEMPIIYADKEVRTKSGALAFEYCSPQEIQDAIDPVMKRNGFCTMTGQTKDEKGFITASVTLYHKDGHSETRSFTVRAGNGNALMSEAQCDAAATTSAERHALVKMLGLRTRIRAEDNPHNEGDFITREEADELCDRLAKCGGDKEAFLAYANADSFYTIFSSRLDALKASLARKEKEAARA